MVFSYKLGPIRPPSEAYSLLLRVTMNCPWNRCKFCHTYKARKFQLRSVEDIKQDINTAKAISDRIREIAWKAGEGGGLREVAAKVLNDSIDETVRNVALWLYAGGENVFLQDANSLIMRTNELVEVISYLKETFPDIKRRILGTTGSFLVIFVILRFVHPAFDLVNTSMVILLAFVILALAVVVISVITRRFNELLKVLKEEMGGVPSADVGRLSAAGSAVALGVANMRRRRARTLLTCLTLVLLTFTVLSFTAVKSFLRSNGLLKMRNPG